MSITQSKKIDQFISTSGNNLFVTIYSTAEVYNPNTERLNTTLNPTSVNYEQGKLNYRISTNKSRTHDNISGLNKRLRNLDP